MSEIDSDEHASSEREEETVSESDVGILNVSSDASDMADSVLGDAGSFVKRMKSFYGQDG